MSTVTGQMTTDERLELLTDQVAMIADELRVQRAQWERWAELVSDSSPVLREAMAIVTAALQEVEAKGYFTFARGGVEIVDQVVTSFDEDDVKALGDNVVLILNTVKELTQPEVMSLLRRTAVTAQEVDDEFADPPSMFGLLKQMRDPQTRRGLARAMTLLHTIGAEQSASRTTS